MAWAKINDEHLTSYANSIRYAKDGTEYTTTLERAREEMHYTPTQMETELQNIAEGYVSAVDELAQDNTYFSEISTAIVDKDGGSPPEKADMAGRIEALQIALPPAVEKDVMFYDYKGELLYSYTFEESLALTELPPIPERDGKIAKEWNWTLQEIQERSSEKRMTLIGAIYTTDDGSTRLHFYVTQNTRIENLQIWVNMDGKQSSIVDWGDGTTSILENTSSSRTAIYVEKNNYSVVNSDTEIIVSIKGGMFILGRGYGYTMFGVQNNKLYNNPPITEIEFGDNCYGLATSAIGNMPLLKYIFFSDIVRISSAYGAFNSCFSLLALIFPRSLTSFPTPSGIGNTDSLKIVIYHPLLQNLLLFNATLASFFVFPDSFNINPADTGYKINSYMMKRIEFPKTENLIIGTNTLVNSYIINYIKIPKNVIRIQSQAFQNCGIKYLDLTDYGDDDIIPVLDNVNFLRADSLEIIAVSSQSKYDEFTIATNWSTYADRFQIKEA